MDLLQMGVRLMAQELGGKASSVSLQNVLGNLIGDGDSMDISSLVAKMQGSSGNLGEIVESWLGDGENAAISTSQLRNVIDKDRLQNTASQLGIDQDSLLETLAHTIPQVVDTGSQGGSLLDSIGGLAGVANLAKGFLR